MAPAPTPARNPAAPLDLDRVAALRRADLLTMIHLAKSGHVGGSLSSVDILTALYYDVLDVRPDEPRWPGRDRFVLSKGHSVEGLLCILADRGFFPRAELATYCRYGSRLIGHPSVKVPGIELCTGALGHGLPAGVGMALGAKRTGQAWRTYVLMGDGEQAEGSVWEAAMAAAAHGLDNLVGILDRNRLQISGPTEQVMPLENLADKWRAFGWEVVRVNGHDIPALIAALRGAPCRPGAPTLVLADTTKGRGVKLMENAVKWHHGVPSKEQLAEALADLGVGEVSF